MRFTNILWRDLAPVLFALACLAGACLVAGLSSLSAHAHHPGSHAWRVAGTDDVRLEATAMATDTCTVIDAVSAGAPDGKISPSGEFPVIIRLRRDEADACHSRPISLKKTQILRISAPSRTIHLFTLLPEGSLSATERVSIK